MIFSIIFFVLGDLTILYVSNRSVEEISHIFVRIAHDVTIKHIVAIGKPNMWVEGVIYRNIIFNNTVKTFAQF